MWGSANFIRTPAKRATPPWPQDPRLRPFRTQGLATTAAQMRKPGDDRKETRYSFVDDETARPAARLTRDRRTHRRRRLNACRLAMPPSAGTVPRRCRMANGRVMRATRPPKTSGIPRPYQPAHAPVRQPCRDAQRACTLLLAVSLAVCTRRWPSGRRVPGSAAGPSGWRSASGSASSRLLPVRAPRPRAGRRRDGPVEATMTDG